MRCLRQSGPFALLLPALLSLVGCSQADPQGSSFDVPEESQSTQENGSSKSEGKTEEKGPGENNPSDAENENGTSSSDISTAAKDSDSIPSDAPASCDDELRNGDESDVDCGGSQCPPCADKKICNRAQDCVSQVCSAGRCMAPTCEDKVRNAQETDTDCGGPDCPKCTGGASCQLARDCRSNDCQDGRCAAEACNRDQDCAHLDRACQVGKCDLQRYRCVRKAANEGGSCVSGRPCVDQESCSAGQCQGGEPRDCSPFADACNAAYCNTSTDRCQTQSLIRWQESFQGITGADTRGWKSRGNSVWRIGPAKESVGCFRAQDPGQDHSPDASGMVLGTMVGDCVRGKISEMDCVFGPSIDLRNAPEDMRLRFWRHLQTEENSVMQHEIRFRRADGTWSTVLYGFPDPIWDSAWTPMSFSVRDYRHKDFAVSICLGHNPNALLRMSVAGWSLDDFSLAPSACSAGL